MCESQELTKYFHNDSFGRFPGLSKCPARHHPLYLFNTSICCVTHAILLHADPLLVSCSFRGAVVTAVFAAVATLRNLERVGTSCQSTASPGQRPVTPCAISLDLLIVSLAGHQQPLFSQQFGGTQKS